jgi:hypothetical protein
VQTTARAAIRLAVRGLQRELGERGVAAH